MKCLDFLRILKAFPLSCDQSILSRSIFVKHIKASASFSILPVAKSRQIRPQADGSIRLNRCLSSHFHFKPILVVSLHFIIDVHIQRRSFEAFSNLYRCNFIQRVLYHRRPLCVAKRGEHLYPRGGQYAWEFGVLRLQVCLAAGSWVGRPWHLGVID